MKNCLCDCTYQRCPEFWTCEEHWPDWAMESDEPNIGEGEI